MFAILHEGAAGGTSLARADQFRFEGFARFGGYPANIHLIAGDALLCVGLLEDQPLPIITEIRLGVVAPKGQLANVFQMGFIRIGQGIPMRACDHLTGREQGGKGEEQGKEAKWTRNGMSVLTLKHGMIDWSCKDTVLFRGIWSDFCQTFFRSGVILGMRMSLAVGHCLLPVVLLLFACKDGSKQQVAPGAGQDATTDSLLLARNPDSAALRMALSSTYEAGGDFRSALQLMESGIKLDSLNPVFWNRKASLLLSMGDTAGATGSLLRSLSVNPSQTDILLELGFIYADRRDAAALSVAEKILSPEGDPRFRTEAHYLKGIYFGNIGRYAEALNAYDQAIASSYTFTDAYIEKGILLFEQKRVRDALQVFEKVLTVNNTLADAYYWRGRCLETGGDKTAALDDYRRALSLDPGILGAQEGEKRLSK